MYNLLSPQVRSKIAMKGTDAALRHRSTAVPPSFTHTTLCYCDFTHICIPYFIDCHTHSRSHADNTSITLVRSCEALKSIVERGASGTFRLLNNITCNKPITIVTDQTVRLEPPQQQSQQPAANGNNNGRVTVGRPFVGALAKSDETAATATTTTTTTMTTTASSDRGADGRGPDGYNLFVLEAGGALMLAFVDCRRSPFPAAAAMVGVGDGYIGGGGGANSSSSGRSSSIGGTALGSARDGVRVVYNAGGSLTIEYCAFSAFSTETGGTSGSGGHDQVESGGVVRCGKGIVVP